ncbi:MAG: glycoside hydrolase family 57 protein [Ferruginibacter sp.]
MQSVCLYFKIHIPCDLKYFTDRYNDAEISPASTVYQRGIDQLADECYLPANKIMLELIEAHRGKFKIAFSISGTSIDMLQQYRPDVLDSFKTLAATGSVEFLAETYYHSFSWLHSKKEFQRQVIMHKEKINEVFNYAAVVFNNTALIYNNELAHFIAQMGYKGILCEGLEALLNGRTPNQVYSAPGNDELAILLRNTRLSDDIAFRFDDATWNEQPLTAEKFAGWVHGHGDDSRNINIYFDYETIGIHKKKATGIFEFLQHLPDAVLVNKNWIFKLPSEVIAEEYPAGVFDAPQIISWKNKSHENCIWSENVMQRKAIYKVYQIENTVLNSNCTEALCYWGYLQNADHFYSMSEHENSGNLLNSNLHGLNSANEVYRQFNHILNKFELHLIQQGLEALRTSQQKERACHLYAGIN